MLSNIPKFKLNILKENSVSEILVFFGYYHGSKEELEHLFYTNPRDNVFRVSYANSDTIDETAPFLFSDIEIETITQNGIDVSFTLLLLNNDETIETIKNKIYIAKPDYSVNEMYLMSKLGEYKTLGLASQTFQANPFLLENEVFELIVNNKWMTPTTDNNLFLCYYEDLKTLFPEKEVFLNCYFPQHDDVADSYKILSMESFYNKIDMFYNIYQNKKGQLKYGDSFVRFKHMDFVIPGVQPIPVSSVFNISHSTEKIPMIKYNTPKKSLNIFRFFSKEVSKSGIKIPFSSLANMNSFNSEIDKRLSVCYYQDGMICQLFENGDIRILLNKTDSLDQCIQFMNDGLDRIFNPLVLFFTQMKITKPVITPEFLENIIFTNLVCVINLIERELKIPFDCIKPVFAVENTAPNTAFLLYKRIPNFNLQSSMESFIESSIKGKKKLRLEDIIENLVDNYNVTKENASAIFQSFYKEFREKEQIGRKLLLINPGLPINITMNPLENTNIFEIYKIPKLNIIKSLFVFIDSMIRITMPESTAYPLSLIRQNCSSETETVVVKYTKPIEMPIEIEITESDEPKIVEKTEHEKELVKSFFAFDSDEEEDEEYVAEDENPQYGGENVEERRKRLMNDNVYVEKILANSSLHNYFSRRMEKYDKDVFKNQPEGRGYTSDCQTNRKRQPIILNRQELDAINRENPELLNQKNDEILQYTTQEGDDLYYICPRYWCLLDNTPMTQEQVDSGQCGKIIDKKVEKGKYVVEFFHKEVHGTRDDYKKTGPGVMKNCLPCCFTNWKSERQKAIMTKCDQKYKFFNETQESPRITIREKIEPVKKRDNFLVVRTDKFPLEEYTWSYPPKSIQIFFNDFNEDHEVSEIDHTIKRNELCIMRHGIENNPRKSFLSCIADIKYFNNGIRLKRTESYTSQLIQLIISKLTLDTFITLQNGALIETFAEPAREIDLDEFAETKIYSVLQTNPTDFAKLCSAFKNYIDFLMSDDYIDYTYTWDLLTLPGIIFANGVNVVIFDLEDSARIKLICPANHYSGSFFNPRKNNIIILKSGVFFEPLFTFIKRPDVKTSPYFDLNELPQNFNDAFNVISTKLRACNPLKSLDYDFEQPILLSLLIEKCKSKGMKPIQVINVRGKVVGLKMFIDDSLQGFIPCFPSSIDDKYEYSLLNDEWNTYSETLDFLTFMGDVVPCNIYSQLVEDGQVIGFLTITNQFVPIEPIELSLIDSELKTSYSYNHYDVDNALLLNDRDNERIEYIEKIKREFELENIFCSYLIYVLNFETNKEILEEIVALTGPIILEEYGISSIVALLKTVPNIVFIEDYTEEMFETTRNCFLEAPPIYFPSDKEERYYTKLATYIFRYQFVKQNLRNVNVYFNFHPVHLRINKDEIYIMQNFIPDNDFILFKRIPFRKSSMRETYDMVEPRTLLKYDANVNFADLITVKPCREKKIPLRNEEWGDLFAKNAMEVSFSSTDDSSCSFMFALSIINKFIAYPIDKEKVIDILDKEYLAQMEKCMLLFRTRDYKKLLDILKNEGKREMIASFIQRGVPEEKVIHHMIHGEYYLTVTDLWILFNYFKIPAVFLYSREIDKILFINEGKSVNYVFIIVSSHKIPKYKYISIEDEIFLDAETFCMKSGIELIHTDFHEYVHNHRIKKLVIADS